MHGLNPKDKGRAYQKLRERMIDARVANAINHMKNAEENQDKDGLSKSGFKRLTSADRKLLYKQYGFSDDESDQGEDGDELGEGGTNMSGGVFKSFSDGRGKRKNRKRY